MLGFNPVYTRTHLWGAIHDPQANKIAAEGLIYGLKELIWLQIRYTIPKFI